MSSLVRSLATVRRQRPDLIYVVDTGIANAGSALLARLAWGLPFVVDTGDLAYELARSVKRPRWPLREFVRLVESLSLRFAESVVVRGTYHATSLSEGGCPRVRVIRDGFTTSELEATDSARIRKDLRLGNSLCVGLVGSLRWDRRHRMCYGWDLVEAIGLLSRRECSQARRVYGLVVGDGDGLPRLMARARELGVCSLVRFVGRVPLSELPSYLRVMDVAISTQSNDAVGNARTTGKLPLYMASGCYVLATDVGEARLLLPREMRLPYRGVRDDAYPERLADRIAELVTLAPEVLRRSTDDLKRTAWTELSYDHLSRLLGAVLDDVVGHHTRL